VQSQTPEAPPPLTPTELLDQINSLFPQQFVETMLGVEIQLCQQTVLPVIEGVVNGTLTRAEGVFTVVESCVNLTDTTEFTTGISLIDFQTTFELALGNALVCDKFSNTVISGDLVEGESFICDALLAGAPSRA
jgi:hypothetical protein